MLATPASASALETHVASTAPAIAADTPAVHVGPHRPAYVRLTVRFAACVHGVRAWVTAGDDGPGNTAVNRIDASEARRGDVFTVWVRISRADAVAMPGTWSVTSVQAEACRTGAPVAIDYPNPVFQVWP
jgi:hypothetical protein